MLEGFLFVSSFLRSRGLKEGVARLRSPVPGLGGGGDFYFLPGQQNSETAHGAPPPAGAHKGFLQPPSKPPSGPVPTPLTGPFGECFRGTGGGGEAETARRGRRARRAVGKRWPRRTGSPRAAPYLGAPRAGEASGGRRGPRTGPLAAGPSWAGAAAAAAGSPGLWAAAAAGAAAAPQAPLRSGNRRPQARPLRGPGPGSGPDQHLGPDRNRPTCSSSSASAAAAAGGRCRCARERTRGEAPRAGSRRRAHSALMEEEDGGPLCSAPRRFGRSGRQLEHPPNPPLQSARPPRLPSAFRFSPKPGSPAFQRGGGEGGSQRPPAARRPRARPPHLLPFAAGWEPRPNRPPGERRPGLQTAPLAAGTRREGEHLVPRRPAEAREGRLP